MTYYHIRYNIYPVHAAPLEKEEWLSFNEKQDEQQVKRLLSGKCGLDVSIILHQVIAEDEYMDKTHAVSMSREQQLNDFNSFNDWQDSMPGDMLRKLNKEADDNDERYKNIDRPDPLL